MSTVWVLVMSSVRVLTSMVRVFVMCGEGVRHVQWCGCIVTVQCAVISTYCL